jgi:SAM-dependent methyltransferase
VEQDVSITPEYEARNHYKDPKVARRYHEQFGGSSSARLRHRILGGWEEKAFAALLDKAGVTGKVLDIACGTGRYVRLMSNRGIAIVGTDISTDMLAVAAESGHGEGPVAFNAGDAARLPFRDRQFAGVTCMRLYHRIPRDVRMAMLREVKRVGSGWAIVFFGMDTPWLRVRRFLLRRSMGRPTNPFPLTHEALAQDLRELGLTVAASRWVMPLLADGLILLVRW